MMDNETREWANTNPKAYRAWRDGDKVFWFTVENLQGHRKRVRSYGATVDIAKENLELALEWEIL